jgi:hypothetical protein
MDRFAREGTKGVNFALARKYWPRRGIMKTVQATKSLRILFARASQCVILLGE